MKRLVKEYINEKFSEDGDPIEDMRIGGLSFNKLSRGSVIKPKVPRLSIASSGHFTYPNKGIDLPINHPILIISVKDYIIPGVKQIYFYNPQHLTEEKEMDHYRQRLAKDEHYAPASWNIHRMLINEKKFNRMFDVIERGF